MIKYKNKFRINTTRLASWDYGSNAPYFVTICTKHKINFFGKIKENIIEFSPLGKIAHQYWLDIPKHFPFVELDEYIIMPNHIHGIIVINKNVESQNLASLHKNKFGPQSQNLASIIRGFKAGVTTYAKINNINFAWQSRYYDHIIRNHKSWENIREYIKQNPKNWSNDEEYKI